jgi:hypothetical protein
MVGRSVEEVARKVARMRFSGPAHERAAGDKEEQACHRHHREGQAASEEVETEDGRMSRRVLHSCRRGKLELRTLYARLTKRLVRCVSVLIVESGIKIPIQLGFLTSYQPTRFGRKEVFASFCVACLEGWRVGYDL